MSDKNTVVSPTSKRPDFVLEASPNPTIAIGPRSIILESSIRENKICAPEQAKKSESSNLILERSKIDWR